MSEYSRLIMPLNTRLLVVCALPLTDSRITHTDLNVTTAGTMQRCKRSNGYADLAASGSVLSDSNVSRDRRQWSERAIKSIPKANACSDLSRLSLTLMLLSSRLMSTRLMLTASPSVNN